jgi:hypothetical protein
MKQGVGFVGSVMTKGSLQGYLGLLPEKLYAQVY